MKQIVVVDVRMIMASTLLHNSTELTVLLGIFASIVLCFEEDLVMYEQRGQE